MKKRRKKKKIGSSQCNSFHFSPTGLLQPDTLVHRKYSWLHRQITKNDVKCNFTDFVHKENLIKLQNSPTISPKCIPYQREFDKAPREVTSSIIFSGKPCIFHCMSKLMLYLRIRLTSFLSLKVIMKMTLSLEIFKQNYKLPFPTNFIGISFSSRWTISLGESLGLHSTAEDVELMEIL